VFVPIGIYYLNCGDRSDDAHATALLYLKKENKALFLDQNNTVGELARENKPNAIVRKQVLPALSKHFGLTGTFVRQQFSRPFPYVNRK